MSEFIESVKRASARFRTNAERLASKDVERANELLALSEDLNAVEQELIRLAGLTSALPPELGNIHDLPEELRAELSVAKTDELEDQLVTVINAYKAEASLDQILIGLYRKFGVTQKRRFIQNKLYRMEMVWSVEGKKGVYTTTKPEAGFLGIETEAEKKPAWDFDQGEDEDSEIPF